MWALQRSRLALAARPQAHDLVPNMNNDRYRMTVIRRVRIREDLKPVKAWWHSGRPDPDWLVITHITGPKGYECFALQFLKALVPHGDGDRAMRLSEMSFETLQIAKAQAHADVGVEYVEWELCQAELTDEDGSIEWGRALPLSEQVGST